MKVGIVLVIDLDDKFLEVAKKEIREELKGLQNILDSSKTDIDVVNNRLGIGNHLHKIKGLAPMMEQNKMGKIAALNDVVIKKLSNDSVADGIYHTLQESTQLMNRLLENPNLDTNELMQKLKTKYSGLLC